MRQTTNLYPMNGGASGPGLRLPSPATLPVTGAALPNTGSRSAAHLRSLPLLPPGSRHPHPARTQVQL